jgi:hypothetical protein
VLRTAVQIDCAILAESCLGKQLVRKIAVGKIGNKVNAAAKDNLATEFKV